MFYVWLWKAGRSIEKASALQNHDGLHVGVDPGALELRDARAAEAVRQVVLVDRGSRRARDRQALAACIRTSRKLVTREQLARITVPALVGVGTKDDIAGSASELADLLPDGRAFDIEGRDHMLSVGDKSFKAAVLDFLQGVKDAA